MPGRLRRPFELTTGLGAPVVSVREKMSNVAQSIECRWHKEHTKEESLSLTAVDEVLIRDAENLHDTRELLLLIFTWEDGKTSVELGQDATQTPHVDSHMVIHPKNNLGRTIESTLDVCIDCTWELVKGLTKNGKCAYSSRAQSSCYQSQ